ncbi:hypothetical protein OBV_07760 [Oscillibacter valericigenes Sjm18-20]|nr:hypothetical protein OBV_07760 [Oscillibacter valericigenes Sjm18-20]
MANRSNRCRTTRTVMSAAASEPEVRRWPHPIQQTYVQAPTEATLHYICCALSYQNELLSEIKTLLEQIAADQSNREAQS